MLFPGCRSFRILPCPGCLIFSTVFKLVKKSLQLQQLLRVQLTHPPYDLFPGHYSLFLSAEALLAVVHVCFIITLIT